MTDCSQQRFEFQGEKSRQVTAEFSGERLTSDGGLLLLRQLEGKESLTALSQIVSSTNARQVR